MNATETAKLVRKPPERLTAAQLRAYQQDYDPEKVATLSLRRNSDWPLCECGEASCPDRRFRT